MSESSEVVSGGISASAAPPLNASTASATVEEGGGGTTPDDAPLGRVGLTLQVSNPLPKEGGTYGSYNVNGLTRRETI